MQSGSIVINCLSAKLIRDTEFFGRMDPICKVRLGS